MTVENLHDAIGQLPSDLITAVDEKRSRKPKVIPFKRYAAMAACLAVILGCSLFLTRLLAPKGGSTENAMLQAADESNRVEAPAAAAPKYDEAHTEAPAAMETECVPFQIGHLTHGHHTEITCQVAGFNFHIIGQLILFAFKNKGFSSVFIELIAVNKIAFQRNYPLRA